MVCFLDHKIFFRIQALQDLPSIASQGIGASKLSKLLKTYTVLIVNGEKWRGNTGIAAMFSDRWLHTKPITPNPSTRTFYCFDNVCN